MSKKKRYFDPPSGWRYGFPKIIPEEILGDQQELFKKWILEQGYPEDEIELALKYGRYWEEEYEK